MPFGEKTDAWGHIYYNVIFTQKIIQPLLHGAGDINGLRPHWSGFLQILKHAETCSEKK